MIHQVYLPALTRRRLTDVVMLQLRLLYYAASTTTLDAASCAQYLDRHTRFRGRGAPIAAWLWRAPKRREPLEEFAQGPTPEKREWSQRLARDALAFLRNPIGSIAHHVNTNAFSWQNAGATFFRNFYNDLCASSGLPGYLFSEPGASPFRRQDFLYEFTGVNRELCVCAACDTSSYYTVVGSSILTDIEHYLPRSRYPHLACHPFNLLPICHLCNLQKRNADPLKGGSSNPRILEDILLPYREPGLSSQTYLQVRLGKSETSTRLGPLRPRVASDLRQKIAAFGNVYKVPARWQGQVNTIGETLFRRMRQFLRIGRSLHSDDTRWQILLDMLDQLLYDLFEDQGKEPFGFAMTWWLATLPISTEPTHGTATEYGSEFRTRAEYLAIAKELRTSIQ